MKKGSISTVVLVLILIAGIGITIYPAFSNWWNTKSQSKAIASYRERVDSLDNSQYEILIEEAEKYNKELAELNFPMIEYKQLENYYEILDITGSGVMGYVTIPQIGISLPVYHGTSEAVLNVAIGHLQGSSLPVGGAGTHSVVMAHRGLPSAKLFSDLDKLVTGDIFTITVLNETYTYQVDMISVVEPDDTEKLEIVSGEDYVTLVTCTPYGINSHRLLVRGKRIENIEAATMSNIVSADATQVDPMIVVPCIAGPLIIILIIIWLFGGKRKKPTKEAVLNKILKADEEESNENKEDC